MGAVSTSLHSSWYNLTHGLIDVAFQCRILGVSSPELLDNIRLIQIEIHDVNNRYEVAAVSVYYFFHLEDNELTLRKLDRGTNK